MKQFFYIRIVFIISFFVLIRFQKYSLSNESGSEITSRHVHPKTDRRLPHNSLQSTISVIILNLFYLMIVNVFSWCFRILQKILNYLNTFNRYQNREVIREIRQYSNLNINVFHYLSLNPFPFKEP